MITLHGLHDVADEVVDDDDVDVDVVNDDDDDNDENVCFCVYFYMRSRMSLFLKRNVICVFFC